MDKCFYCSAQAAHLYQVGTDCKRIPASDQHLMDLAGGVDALIPIEKVREIMDLPAGVGQSFAQDMQEAIDMRGDVDPVFTVADVLEAMGNWLRMLRTNRRIVATREGWRIENESEGGV